MAGSWLIGKSQGAGLGALLTITRSRDVVFLLLLGIGATGIPMIFRPPGRRKFMERCFFLASFSRCVGGGRLAWRRLGRDWGSRSILARVEGADEFYGSWGVTKNALEMGCCCFFGEGGAVVEDLL